MENANDTMMMSRTRRALDLLNLREIKDYMCDNAPTSFREAAEWMWGRGSRTTTEARRSDTTSRIRDTLQQLMMGNTSSPAPPSTASDSLDGRTSAKSSARPGDGGQNRAASSVLSVLKQLAGPNSIRLGRWQISVSDVEDVTWELGFVLMSCLIAFLVVFVLVRLCFKGVVRSRRPSRRAGDRRRRSGKHRGSEIFHSGRSLTYEASGNLTPEADGMEILRTGGRGRFGTFDFFGMNHSGAGRRDRGRGRTTSADSLEAIDFQRSNNNKGLRRDRLGSMDVFYGRGGTRAANGAVVGRGAELQSSLHSRDTYPSGRSRNGKARTASEEASRGTRGFMLASEPYLSSPAVLDEGGGERYLYDEFGIVTLSHRVEYYGPSQAALKYSTCTPPTCWAEASRRIIPTAIMTKLERRLFLNVMVGRLEVTEPTSGGQWDFSLSAEEISMHAQRPLEGGVVSLYVKGTPKEEWMEHTFETAHAAAQFQLDLLAYQIVGKALQHIFEALNLVHHGSVAYAGQEYVLHDEHRGKEEDSPDSPPSAKSLDAPRCVAWDDAMRAMSSIPTVRIALERLWLTHRHPSNITPFGRKRSNKKSKDLAGIAVDDKGTANLGLLTEEYLGKRLLLGPVDFFRLFVPALPGTAIPEGESNRVRMEQLLSWRKRVARAAVLVRSYTRAHRITNLGWNLSHGPGDTAEKAVRRLAYDGNEDNTVRDTAAKNELYEASVSRDVLCYVRPFDYLSDPDDDLADQSNKKLVLSPYQAYSYVGSHYFKLTPEIIEEGAPMHPSRDPIDVFPSLKALVAKNSDQDFWITGFTDPDLLVSFVHVYVRSLAKGIDPQFDKVMDRFSKGSRESRESRLFLMFQLGNRMGLSYGGWLFLRFLSFLFELFQTGRDSPISLESTRDRYAFPAVKISSFFRTFHFGGALQTDRGKPTNYVAMNTFLTSSNIRSRISRMMFQRIQAHVSDSITDFTYVIEGEHEDELPERALSTIRQVHIDPRKIARDPSPHIALPESEHQSIPDTPGTGFQKIIAETFETMANIVSSPLRSRSLASPVQCDKVSICLGNCDGPEGPQENVNECDAFDPVERAVADVVDILDVVSVPSRLTAPNLSIRKSETNDNFSEESEETGLMVMTLVAVLDIMDRHDIERYIRVNDFDLHEASVRLVETAAWRGKTFPIDKRKCRIELQNGQFFQQGFDKETNPVYYFRNMCLGPWRMDEDAVVSAILYRFDQSLREFCKTNPFTKVTLIALMGIPNTQKAIDNSKKDALVGGNEAVEETEELDEEEKTGDDDEKDGTPDLSADAKTSLGNSTDDTPTNATQVGSCGNPRVSPDEHWKCHSNKQIMEKLFPILIAHYPSRLAVALIVKGRGNNTYYRDKFQGNRKLRKLLGAQLVQDRVRFVNTSELTKYVEVKDLVTIAGGTAKIDDSAYDF